MQDRFRAHMPVLGSHCQNYMMHYILGLANQRQLVYQFHTGLQEGIGNYISWSDPTLMTNLFLEYPDIRFDLPGKTAGQVRIRAGRLCLVRYNLGLLQRHPEDFLTATVPHETAHLVTVRLFGTGVKPHGREWRAVMRLFGAEPRRCHDYDVEGLQAHRIRRFRYHCGCRSHLLTSIRHNRILDGQVYLCRGCGHPLELATEDREREPR